MRRTGGDRDAVHRHIEERGGNIKQNADDDEAQEHLDAIERQAAVIADLRRAKALFRPGGKGYYAARREYMGLEDKATAAALRGAAEHGSSVTSKCVVS